VRFPQPPSIGSRIADSSSSFYRVIQVDGHASFDKGWLVVRRLVHESACAGLLGWARSRSLGTEGAEALLRWDPPDYLPSLALEYNMWSALEPVGSRISSNACALVVPDSVNLGHLFRTHRGSSSEPLISRDTAGWQLGAPDFSHLQDSRAHSRSGPRTANQ
jgi:hypothetical protein